MKTASCLGCLTMDILDPPIGTKWGQFNDRRVDHEWVQKLANRFDNHKLDNCTDGTVMEIAIRPHWVASVGKAIPKVDGKYIHQVNELELTPIGKREILQDKLWVLGGNHRRLALEVYIGRLKTQLDQLKGKDLKLKAKLAKSRRVVGSTRAETLSTKAVADMEEKIRNSSKWAVRLYDRGEQTVLFSIYMHANALCIQTLSRSSARMNLMPCSGFCRGTRRGRT